MMRLVMKPLLKFLHLVAAIGFAGALAVSILLAATVDESTGTSFAAGRRAIATVASTITLPSMVLLVVTGLLLMVRQPAFMEARWAQIKALIGLLVTGIVLLVVQPAVTRMGGLAQAAIEGSPVRGWALTTTRVELIGGAACLVLCLAAVALAVWRPALRRRSS
jgi:hypothetical protein